MLVFEFVCFPVDLADITIERDNLRTLQKLFSHKHTQSPVSIGNTRREMDVEKIKVERQTSNAKSTLPSALYSIASLTFNNFSTASLLGPAPLFILT